MVLEKVPFEISIDSRFGKCYNKMTSQVVYLQLGEDGKIQLQDSYLKIIIYQS
jgi:hypothetical protein